MLDQNARHPARERNELVGLPHPPMVDRQPQLLPPDRLRQLVRIKRVRRAVDDRGLVVAADVQRPLRDIAAQAAQHVGLEQVDHHRIEAPTLLSKSQCVIPYVTILADSDAWFVSFTECFSARRFSIHEISRRTSW